MNAHSYVAVPERRFADWLMDPIRRNRSVYVKVGLAAAVINIFALVTSLFTMTVYDRVLPNNAVASLIGLSIGLAIVMIFDFVLKLLRAYFIDVAGADIDREIGGTLFDRLLAMRLELRKASTGALAGLMRELETLRDFFASATLTAMVDVPFILVTLAVIAMIGGPLVWVPLLMIPVVVGVSLATTPAMNRLAATSMGESMIKQSVLVETIGGIEMVKTAGAGNLLRQRWLQSIDRHSNESLRQRLVSTVSLTFAGSAQQLAYAAVVVVGVGLIAKQELTMGGLIACSILAGRAVAPLGQIAGLLTRVATTRTAYRQLNEIMRQPAEGPQGAGLQVAEVRGAIAFKDVTFTYPGAAEPALRDVSFAINPGERVALLGPIGSGKSTVARLIMGLYPPDTGLVLIDGVDIRQYDPETLRSRIGATMQEVVLLTGSVRDNIALGRAEVNDEEMLRVAGITGTHSFMAKLTNGYDLKLADRGEGLSGGQRQSIALARALAGNPTILLFDEPSSAFDSGNEAGLIQRLKDEVQGKTMVVVTHRPPVLALVDRIIIMDGGRITADGPRDEILKRISGPRKATA